MSPFQPNCTLPSSTTNYTSSPNVRGTLDIVWSCLSILILCLWNVIHINVRAPLYPSKTWSKQWLFNRTRTVLLKTQWMGIAFFAPEILIAKALHDKFIVNESVTVMRNFAERDGVRWTAMHAHFANMGAFVVQFGPSTWPAPSQPPAPPANTTQIAEGNPPPDKLPEISSQEKPDTNLELRGDRSMPSGASPLPLKEENGKTTEIRIEHKAVPVGKQHAAINGISEALPSKDRALICQPPVSELTDAFGQPLKTVAPRYGQETWEPNDTNTKTTREALNILKTSEVFSIRFRNRQRNALALQGNIWILDAAQMATARSFSLFNLPDIHEEHLESESKSDPLLKLLTMTQVGFMAIQLLVRLYRHLPTSQLEIMTFAYAICSIITYIALLEKPKDVALTKPIRALRYPTATELLDIALAGPSTIFRYRPGYWMPNNIVHHLGNSQAMTATTSASPSSPASPSESQTLTIQQKIKRLDAAASHSRILFIATGCIGATLFGSLHFISWNFHFPTPLERLLWRIAICVTVSLPLLGASAQSLFALFFQLRTRNRTRKTSSKQNEHRKSHVALERYQRTYLRVTTLLLSIVALFYVLVRVFVMVEVFRSLAFLPPGAYRATWAVSLPHIG